MVEVKELNELECNLKYILVDKLKEFVKENGDDIGNYERNLFGLDEDEQEGVTLTKVLNFFDNGGCYFPTTREALTKFEPWNKESVKDVTEELSDKFMYWAFQCLYIEVDENLTTKENLKYYTFYNDGTYFSDNLSEPEHEYVNNLPLEVICKIIDVIKYSYEQRASNQTAG